jgi:class 3 adenylate cyclase
VSDTNLLAHQRVVKAAFAIQGDTPPGLVPRHSESELASVVTGVTGEPGSDWHTSRDREVLLAALLECERRGWMNLIKVMGPWSWELTANGQEAARSLESSPATSTKGREQQRPVRPNPVARERPFHERLLIEAARLQGDQLDEVPRRKESELRSVAEGVSGEAATDWRGSRDRELLLAGLAECERRGWMRLLKVMGPWGWTVTSIGLEKARQLRDATRGAAPAPPNIEQLPSGVVTFLLTDIEGSTQLWETNRSSMREAVRAHTNVITEVVEAAGGKVIKSRGEGDSTFSVFWQPTDAIAAALAMQIDFQTRIWPEGCELRVRAAIHAGQTNPVDDDYLGPVVNRCARMRGLAHGGQVLVSMVVRELVWDGLPTGASLRYLGEFQPEGLMRPEAVFQLCHDQLPAAFPPLRGQPPDR